MMTQYYFNYIELVLIIGHDMSFSASVIIVTRLRAGRQWFDSRRDRMSRVILHCMALCLVKHQGRLYFYILPANLIVCSELVGQNAFETVPCSIQFTVGAFLCCRPTINWTVNGGMRERIAHVLRKRMACFSDVNVENVIS